MAVKIWWGVDVSPRITTPPVTGLSMTFWLRMMIWIAPALPPLPHRAVGVSAFVTANQRLFPSIVGMAVMVMTTIQQYQASA